MDIQTLAFSFFDWAKAHPEICLAAAMALITYAGKPRTEEEFKAMNPFKAQMLRLVAAIGPDLVKAYKVLGEIKNPPSPPPEEKKDGDA